MNKRFALKSLVLAAAALSTALSTGLIQIKK